jgi:hypothetical protein
MGAGEIFKCIFYKINKAAGEWQAIKTFVNLINWIDLDECN